jgi:hypothetical protein
VYPEYRDGLAPDRVECFPLPGIVSENLLHLSTWVLAGWLVWPVQIGGWPVATIAWAVIVLVIQTLLKKHVCTGCYYWGKRCHLGWGLLAASLFPQDSGNREISLKLTLFYVLTPPVFLVAGLAVGLLLHPGTLHWALLGAFMVLEGLLFALRKPGCARCAMRRVCPGSAAKG